MTIRSYGVNDYQWAEVACNTAESNGGSVIAITAYGWYDQPGLRVWVRWPDGNHRGHDAVQERLLGHRESTE